jgi:NAD-dependent SIR2 family protein deacetylase
MPQIFHPSTNTISKVSIFGAVFFLGGFLWLLGALNRSSYVTRAGVTRNQPIPFSHKHHVQGLGIDCRHCHWPVEESSFAGIPPTKTCMTCHSQVWSDSAMLEPVRESFRSDRSIEWVRVHDLPDFVYFNHSIHVSKGVGCVTCHGQVDQMSLMRQQESLQMEWCWSCHEHPGPNLRPRQEVFNPNWQPPDDRLALAETLMKEYNVRSALDCSTCHR